MKEQLTFEQILAMEERLSYLQHLIDSEAFIGIEEEAEYFRLMRELSRPENCSITAGLNETNNQI